MTFLSSDTLLTTNTALACQGLVRHFTSAHTTIHVLKGVALQIAAGSITAILGPSGSGKTTLLHLLAGLDRPNEGRIYWGDLEVQGLPQNRLALERSKRLGLIFQHHYLLEDINVLDNVTLTGRLNGTVDPKRAETLLMRIGLKDRMHFMPSTLSGGERQRVAVARALYSRPQVVLADEPTGSLDRHTAKQVYQLLVELAREENTAVLMVTHDEGLVQDVDERYTLDDGVLRRLG